MPYGIQHLHSTGLNSLIGLEPSSTRVNKDFRHGWLETVGRVTPHEAVVCTSFILIGKFKNGYLRKGIFILFVQWALVVYIRKTSQKAFAERSEGSKHLVCADVIWVAGKELGELANRCWQDWGGKWVRVRRNSPMRVEVLQSYCLS